MTDIVSLLRQGCTEDVKRINEEVKHLIKKSKNMTLSGLSISLGAESISILREMLSGEINNAIDSITEKAQDEIEKNSKITKLIASSISLFDIASITSSMEIIKSLLGAIEELRDTAKENMLKCRVIEFVKRNGDIAGYIIENSLEEDCEEYIKKMIAIDEEGVNAIKEIYGDDYLENSLEREIKKIIIVLSELNPKSFEFKNLKEDFINSRSGSYGIKKEKALAFKKKSNQYVNSFYNDGNLKTMINQFYKRLNEPISLLVDNNFFIPTKYNGSDYAQLKMSSALITLKIENYFFLVASKMQKVIDTKKATDVDHNVEYIYDCINSINEFVSLVDELSSIEASASMYRSSKALSGVFRLADTILKKTGIKPLAISLEEYLKKSISTIDVVVNEIKLKSTLYNNLSYKEKVENQCSDILFYINGVSELYYEISKEDEVIEKIKDKYDKLHKAYYQVAEITGNGNKYSNLATELSENFIRDNLYSVLYKNKFSKVIAGGNSFSSLFKPQESILENITTLKDDIVSTKEKYTSYYSFIKYTYKELKNNVKIMKKTGLL